MFERFAEYAGIITGVVVFALIVSFRSEFIANYGLLVALLILLQIVPKLVVRLRLDRKMTVPMATAAANSCLGIACTLALAIFIFYPAVRDRVGKEYIDGYYTTHYETETDYGSPMEGTEANASHWYSRLAIWIFDVLSFVFPFLIVGVGWTSWENVVSEVKWRQYEEPRQKGTRL